MGSDHGSFGKFGLSIIAFRVLFLALLFTLDFICRFCFGF
jgi:hypothetical protein